MRIRTNVYADFLALIKGVRGQGPVFYWESPNQAQFEIYAITNDGSTVLRFPKVTQIKPATFDADFPDAVQLEDIPAFPDAF